MISGLSPSVYSAIRTVDNAQKNSQKFANQMTTGKKVNSAKDNGAAYAISVNLQSQISQIDGRENLIGMLQTVATEQAAQDQASNAAVEWMKDVIRRALSYAPSTNQREILDAEFQTARQEWQNSRAGEMPIQTSSAQGSGWGVRGTSEDALISGNWVYSLAGGSWFDHGHGTVDYASNGILINSIDVLNGSNALLQSAIVTLDAHLASANAHTTYGQDQNWLDRITLTSQKQKDRVLNAISSLTDADLGKVSAQKANADARQSLALQTINSAISAYSNKAGSLLNNILGTQRSVMA